MRGLRPIHVSAFTADHMLDGQTRFNPDGHEKWDRDGKLLNGFAWEEAEAHDSPESRCYALRYVIGLAYDDDQLWDESNGCLQAIDVNGTTVRVWAWDGRCFARDFGAVPLRWMAKAFVDFMAWVTRPTIYLGGIA